MSVAVSIDGLDLVVTATPLRSEDFAPFGEVVQNPRPDLHPSRHPALLVDDVAAQSRLEELPFGGVSANQGTAIKYQHVSRMVNLYDQAPSRVPSSAVMNMFVCAVRKLRPRRSTSSPVSGASSRGDEYFEVRILERHPYTTQTFTPLAAGPGKRYLVIVAPSLTPADADAGLPVPSSGVPHGLSRVLPGRGLPDLRHLKAFVATADQAVTYGAGTWHAPMVALGPEGTAVDFIVVQFANGVGLEDCQEALFQASGGQRWGVSVHVPRAQETSRL